MRRVDTARDFEADRIDRKTAALNAKETTRHWRIAGGLRVDCEWVVVGFRSDCGGISLGLWGDCGWIDLAAVD